MARTVRNQKIDTPSAGAPGEAAQPVLDGDQPPSATARVPKAGRGSRAYDANDADGVTVFSYAQAQARAREWSRKKSVN